MVFFLACCSVSKAEDPEVPETPPKKPQPDKVFTAKERAQLRVALGKVLNDREVIASRNRVRTAAEAYKSELRRAIKRTSPELGEKVEKMLVERLTSSDKDFSIIRFRSFFMPVKDLPPPLKIRAKVFFGKLGADPEMERLRRESINTRNIPERSRIFGAMRARIAELIEKEDPSLFQILLPLPSADHSRG